MHYTEDTMLIVDVVCLANILFRILFCMLSSCSLNHNPHKILLKQYESVVVFTTKSKTNIHFVLT